MFLIYLQDGINVYGSRHGEFWGTASVYGVESCKIMFLARHFLFTCSDTFAVGCISLSYNTIHLDKDGQTDRWRYHANSRSYCMQQ